MMNGKSSKRKRLNSERKRSVNSSSSSFNNNNGEVRRSSFDGGYNPALENTVIVASEPFPIVHQTSQFSYPPQNFPHIGMNSSGRSYGSHYSSDYTSSSSYGNSFILSSTPNAAFPCNFPYLTDRSGSYSGCSSSYDTPPPPPPPLPPQVQPLPPTQPPPPYVNEVPMPRNDFSSPPPSQAQASPNTSSSAIKAVVEKNGYVSFMLGQEILVDIAPNQAIRMTNKKQGVTLALSGCGTQMSLVHPQGRVLQYNSRIEMQGEDVISVKNAKMWPKGVSFTANNCALVYLVDKAGVRSTSDTFFDLTSNNTSDSMFLMSCSLSATNLAQAIYQSIENLREAEFWRTADGLNCWGINGVLIRQTSDGLTTVERQHGAEKFVLKTSPNNGKARLESSFLYVTASLGEEAHIFIKSEDRRLHYNGNSFQIRNGGHAAGFNESGSLRIW